MYTEKSEFPCLNNDKKKKANQEVRCQATVLSDSHDLSLAGEGRGGRREWREASRRQKGKKGGTIEN